MFPVLCKHYEASVGAIREALVALVAQGLVETQAHQGYVVRPVTREDLLELTAARMAVEPIVLRESIRDGDLNWESRVIMTHHVMGRLPREDEAASNGLSNEWMAAHHAFHGALFSGCTNARLLATVEGFSKQATLYGRWSVPFETDRDMAAEHTALLDAAMDRDADLAVERLLRHIGRTTELQITQAHEIMAAPAAASAD